MEDVVVISIVCTLTAMSFAVMLLGGIYAIKLQFNQLKEFITMTSKELLDKFNEATNNLAERIAARDAKIKDAGELTPELEQEGRDIVARLNGLAADPADPVPQETAPEVPGSSSDSGSGSSDSGSGSDSGSSSQG